MRNVISSRQTELALSTGRLFTTDEALKIGLIDEVATDKTDAIAKAEKFLLRMSKISSKCNFACSSLCVAITIYCPGTGDSHLLHHWC
jgi:enoyl-CoA hydratase/carnithine racemase